MTRNVQKEHLQEIFSNFGKIKEVEFGIKVLKYTQSAMERQILESVKIQEEREKHQILNSKAEYSRCTIPRLTTVG